VFDSGELQPGLQRDDGAAELAGAAPDFDLAPAGLAAQGDQDALVEDLGPAGSVLGLLGAAVEPDDFRAPQPAGEADQQDGAVAQASQGAEIERRDHRLQVLGQDRFFLFGRPSLGAADAGEDGGDVAVGAVEFFSPLREIPPQGRDPPLEGGDRVGFSGDRPGGAGGDIEAQDLGIRGQGGESVAACPGRIVSPVGSVGSARVRRTRGLGVVGPCG